MVHWEKSVNLAFKRQVFLFRVVFLFKRQAATAQAPRVPQPVCYPSPAPPVDHLAAKSISLEARRPPQLSCACGTGDGVSGTCGAQPVTGRNSLSSSHKLQSRYSFFLSPSIVAMAQRITSVSFSWIN